MLIIGELINCTRKRVGEAAAKRDTEFIQNLARKQMEAGAHMLDLNGDLPGQEVEVLTWLTSVVQEIADLPLCLDSANPNAILQALPLCRRPPMINSLNDEPARWDMLPTLREYRPKVIALCTSETGVPTDVVDRVAIASTLIDRLTAEGFVLDDIYVDACVLPIATGPQGRKLMGAVSQIAAAYPGVHLSAGVSNVSFGMPQRKLLNESFLLLLMAHGLDTAIVDPCDPQLMMNILAAEALLGRDERCKIYLRAYREGKLDHGAVQKSTNPEAALASSSR